MDSILILHNFVDMSSLPLLEEHADKTFACQISFQNLTLSIDRPVNSRQCEECNFIYSTWMIYGSNGIIYSILTKSQKKMPLGHQTIEV